MSPLCTICLSPVEDAAQALHCPQCQALHHDDCWAENSGCGVYGCKQAPAVQPRQDIEIPSSHWGRTDKPCPACGAEINAAALRCKRCGTTFSSATPEDSHLFRARQATSNQAPALRRGSIILFVLCILPCLAPLGLLYGLIWYPLHRRQLLALPPLHNTLCLIGLAIALFVTVGIAVATALYEVGGGN